MLLNLPAFLCTLFVISLLCVLFYTQNQLENSITEPVIPTDVENKPFLWAEDAFDPIIVKHNQKAYDLCQGKPKALKHLCSHPSPYDVVQLSTTKVGLV